MKSIITLILLTFSITGNSQEVIDLFISEYKPGIPLLTFKTKEIYMLNRSGGPYFHLEIQRKYAGEGAYYWSHIASLPSDDSQNGKQRECYFIDSNPINGIDRVTNKESYGLYRIVARADDGTLNELLAKDSTYWYVKYLPNNH